MAFVSRTRLIIGAGTLALSTIRCALMPAVDELSGGERVSDAAAEQRDAASPDGGDAGRWCDSVSPKPMFCDDFDDQGPLSRWDGQYTRAGGFVGRDDASARSAPSSLLVVTPPATGPGSAIVYRATTTPKSKVRVAYDVKIDARDSKSGYAESDYIRFDGPLRFSVYLRLNLDPKVTNVITSEAYPDGGVQAHDVSLGVGSRFDAWTRVVVTVDLASNPRTLTATLDGVPVASQVLEPSLYGPGPVAVQPGLGYTGAPTESDWRIRYDNVTIDWE